MARQRQAEHPGAPTGHGPPRRAPLWPILRDCPLAVVGFDRQARVVFWNPASTARFGWSEAEVLGRPLPVLATDQARRLEGLVAALQDGRPGATIDLRWRRQDGDPVHTPLAVWPLGAKEGGVAGALGLVLDHPCDVVAATHAPGLLGELIANTPLAVIEWDGRHEIRRWSARAEAIFGWRADEVLGRRIDELDLAHPDDRRRIALAIHALIEGDVGHSVVDQRNLTRARAPRVCRWYNSIVRRGDGTDVTILSLIEDVTEHRAAQERIRVLAEHDALTGLPNRALFMDRLAQALARCRRQSCRGALLLGDLDRFKEVNDAHGHQVGDRVLSEVAARLRATVRESDTVARFGGDEFALILPEVETPEAAGLVAAKIDEALRRPIRLDGEEIRGGITFGITMFPDHGDDPDGLLTNADLALYRAKAAGRGSWAVYTPGMSRLVVARRTLIEELREAVAEGAFELHYQPRVHLATGAVEGVEALLRWHHPVRGLLAPAAFLEAAENSGTIRPIGRLVLRLACAQARRWRAQSLPPLPIAINLSASECRQADLAMRIDRLLARAGLPADALELEVDEVTLLDGGAGGPPAGLAGLQPHGPGVVIDRFGDRLASLRRLGSGRIRRVKLDPELVRACDGDGTARAIVATTIDLGHRLGLPVAAAGVETPAQRDRLLELGCDEAQGLLFAPPLGAVDLVRFVRVGPSGRPALGAPSGRHWDPVASRHQTPG